MVLTHTVIAVEVLSNLPPHLSNDAYIIRRKVAHLLGKEQTKVWKGHKHWIKSAIESLSMKHDLVIRQG